MFCHYRRSAPATKQRDKMCFWSTARTPKRYDQASPDTFSDKCLSSVFNLFATCLLGVCNVFAMCPESVCSVFIACLLPDLLLHDQGTLAMYTSPRRKGAPSESRSSLHADHSR
jgi:hypothetical protein